MLVTAAIHMPDDLDSIRMWTGSTITLIHSETLEAVKIAILHQHSYLYHLEIRGMILKRTYKWTLIGTTLAFLGGTHTSLAQETSTTLEEIVVENPGEPTTTNPLGIGVSGQTLKTTPGSGGDPLRSLQSLPGMTFTDDTESEPAVRGSRPGDNIFLVDFAPIGELFHAGGIISVFNSELVESFSIYPSAYGPEYYGATGGVFDVTLRDPKTDRFHLTADFSFFHAGILLEGPITENQSFYLAGRKSYIDLLVSDQIEEEEEGFTIVEFPNYDDYQGKYVWNLSEDSTLKFQINGATDDLEFLVDESAEDIGNETILAGRTFLSSRSDSQALMLENKLGSANLKSILSHNNIRDEAVIGQAGTFDITNHNYLLKSHLTVPLGDSHDITVGVDVQQDRPKFVIDFNAPACTEFEAECDLTTADRLQVNRDFKINSGHVFLKDNWYIGDKVTLIPGISAQTEDYLDESFVEPRLSMEYQLNDDLILSAGAGVYHQMPDIDQIDAVFGNPELEYIESTQAVIGLEKNFGNGWNIKTEAYYKDLDNLVTGSEELRYENQGEGEAYGLDTLIRKNLTDKFSGWLSVSLSEAKRRHKVTDDSFVFDYDQPYNISLVTSYKFSPKWSLGAKLWLHSGAPYTPVVGSIPDPDNEGRFLPVYGDINSERFSDYQRLDIRLDRTFQRSRNRTWTAYLDLINVTDADNQSGYQYNEDFSEETEVKQIPRFLSLGFRAEF